MFFRNKAANLNNAKSAAQKLGTDIHSHILPGIDDGAKDSAESFAMLQLMQDLGYQRVITTPHISSDYYPNTRAGIQEVAHTLQEELSQSSLTISLQVAAEYMLDDGFADVYKRGPLLSFGKSYVLVEFPFHQAYPGMKEYLFQLQLDEYQPVLAHPERYHYWIENPKELMELHDAGLIFQVNLMSLTGLYGKPVKRQAENLLKAGMVQLFGSDLHKSASLPDLQAALGSRLVSDYAGSMLNARL